MLMKPLRHDQERYLTLEGVVYLQTQLADHRLALERKIEQREVELRAQVQGLTLQAQNTPQLQEHLDQCRREVS